MAIEGAIVAVDAMGGGCRAAPSPARSQQDPSKIEDKKAGYILALKPNRETLRADAGVFAGEQKARVKT